MTSQQARAIERITNNIVEKQKRIGSGVVKASTISESKTSSLVFLQLTIGRENDEGTMAEVFCRLRTHYAIGPRGGVKVISAYDGTSTVQKKYLYQYK